MREILRTGISGLIQSAVKLSLVVSTTGLVGGIWLVGVALVSPLLDPGTTLIGGQSFVIMNFLSSLILVMGELLSPWSF